MSNWEKGSFPFNNEIPSQAQIAFDVLAVPETYSRGVFASLSVHTRASGNGVKNNRASMFVTLVRRMPTGEERQYVFGPQGNLGPIDPVTNPLRPCCISGPEGGQLNTSLDLTDPNHPVLFLPGDSKLRAWVVYDSGTSVNLDFIKLGVRSWGPWI